MFVHHAGEDHQVGVVGPGFPRKYGVMNCGLCGACWTFYEEGINVTE